MHILYFQLIVHLDFSYDRWHIIGIKLALTKLKAEKVAGLT